MNFYTIAIGIFLTIKPLLPEVYYYCQETSPPKNYLKYANTYKGQENKTIKVITTGYYAPLERQKFYARKTYYDEIKMNGLGKRTFT